MQLADANEVLRKAVISNYFEPELRKLGYKPSRQKHPHYEKPGLSRDGYIHLFFDTSTGNDYPDGDEWFIVEYLFPYVVELPDPLKSPDYFTRLTGSQGKAAKVFWRHRELIRYRHGKIKRLDEALAFMHRKAQELVKSLQDAAVTKSLKAHM
jgi:hypothetical protein